MKEGKDTLNLQKYISKLYDDITGFINYDPGEKEQYSEQNIFPLYGEILYTELEKIIKTLNITDQDIFYDLGSGVGKIPLQFFLTTPVKKSVGIEGFPKRHQGALLAFQEVHQDFPILFKERQLIAIEGNYLEQDFKDATIIFVACFEESVLGSLTKLLQECDNLKYLISLRPISTQLPLLKIINVEYTFGKIDAYIYAREY